MPREGHDRDGGTSMRTAGISIHVPREGHDTILRVTKQKIIEFQSTCPARGTTSFGVRPVTGREISIHVPREGHDAGRSF